MATKRKTGGNKKPGKDGIPGATAAMPTPTDAQGRLSVMIEMSGMPGGSAMSALRTAESMATALPGFQVDPKFEPVTMGQQPGPGMASSTAPANPTYIVRGTVASVAEIERLKQQPGVAAVWMDTPIAGFACPIPPCDCDPGTPKGSITDVATYLGVDGIWTLGRRGTGIVVGVVDSGVTAIGRTLKAGEAPSRLIPRVIGGWPTDDWGTESSRWGYHGNMCATDVLGMAPDAQIFDLRVAGAGGSPGTISRALQAFQWAINQHRLDGTPHVLTNSWGIFQESWDPAYARNPNHPFVRKVEEALNEGILVLFAAGNCGDSCPDGRCGPDNGPGRSIWGANGHPRVMTVGAVNKNEQFIGYSSQGPAALDPDKPDFCSVSHFTGYFTSDSGTSAATPIAAGVVALMKQGKPSMTQDQCKAALKNTAKDIGPGGFDRHSGAGIIRGRQAYDNVVAAPTSVFADTSPSRDLLTLPVTDTSPTRDVITSPANDTSPLRDVVTRPAFDTSPVRDILTIPQRDTNPLLDRIGTDPRVDPISFQPGVAHGQTPFVLATPHQAPDWQSFQPGEDVAALEQLEGQIREAEELLQMQQAYLDQLVAQYQSLSAQGA